MSRAAGIVLKAGMFLALVAGATFLFRKDSLRGLSNRWTLIKCQDLVASDIRALTPELNPKVDHCEGEPSRAICIVETTERDGRKTAPVKNWDCAKRHFREDAFLNDLGKAGVNAPAPGDKFDRERAKKFMAQVEKAKGDLDESMKYVTTRMEERRALLDGR